LSPKITISLTSITSCVSLKYTQTPTAATLTTTTKANPPLQPVKVPI
jgi:hypothetical protein